MNQDASRQPGADPGEVIFGVALELTAAARAAYLDNACGHDAKLREHVESLLKAHDQSGAFLEAAAAPPVNKTVTLKLPLTEKPGDRIGRYKLLQQIGEGGCGVVYMAEQEEPVRRRVALKVIKPGVDTRSVIARFEAERQALAMMDHPNIARVLDAGATDTGRPFFVMELVRGIKITEYCDQNKLTTEDRLKLFIQVCHAIQHAHQKGIIHRDIKPSNILVTLHDGVPVPKVIDFGIAKATQGRLTDETLFTAFEQFIGTPAYMSPEQAEMSGLDVDTRCDIYALGVLLYELLTGRTPFDARELLASGLDKMRHTIREEEPQRPSTRLSTMLEVDLTTMAKSRQTDAPKLLSILRGDLDWIVMKTLEKDRTRRYETASALAGDVQSYLDYEPVVARPPSRAYKIQKFVRRHQIAVRVAAGVGLLLLVLAGFLVEEYLRAERLRKRAEMALEYESRLRRAAELGKKYSDVGLLMSKGRWDDADQLAGELPIIPEGAAIYMVLATIDARYGAWAKSVTNYIRLIQIRPDDPDNYHLLAPLLLQLDQTDAYRQHCQRLIGHFGGTTNPMVAERMAKDCLMLPPDAKDLPVINQWVATAIAAGPAHSAWPWFEFVKGLAAFRQGNFAEAIEWEQKTLENRKDVYRTAQAFMVLAMAQSASGQSDKARATFGEGMEYADSHIRKLDKKQGLDEMWNDWITANVLIREAKSRFGEPAGSGDGSK